MRYVIEDRRYRFRSAFDMEAGAYRAQYGDVRQLHLVVRPRVGTGCSVCAYPSNGTTCATASARLTGTSSLSMSSSW